jgi:hypothetical protein
MLDYVECSWTIEQLRRISNGQDDEKRFLLFEREVLYDILLSTVDALIKITRQFKRQLPY